MIRHRVLSRRDHWRMYVDDPPLTKPEKETPARLQALGEAARGEYDQSRHQWHRNRPLVKTPQLTALHESLDEVMQSNPEGGDRMPGVASIDALPALGKTTVANTFGREFDRAEMRREGPLTEAGQERVPVLRVGLGSGNTVRSLSEKMCRFYGHPSVAKPSAAVNADRLGFYALDCVLAAETKLAIIDDIHFMDPRRKDGRDVTNHMKFLNSEFPVTFLFVGVQLSKKGFYDEGESDASADNAQNGRRWTRLEMLPFEIDTDMQRREWHSLLKATEQRLVLARAHPGMLTELADYLFARCSGRIGSLSTLITRGCYRAICSGEERLTRDLLEPIRIDEAAEKKRAELMAGFATGRLTTRPQGRRKASAAATG